MSVTKVANRASCFTRGQEYTRAELDRDGDRCEWFAVSHDIAVDIAGTLDPAACDRPERPFASQLAPVSSDLYLRQRIIFSRLERGLVDPIEAEKSIIGIVAEVVAVRPV